MRETTIPVLPCSSADACVAFYGALGFETVYRMTRPYLYLALRRQGIQLHFHQAPARAVAGDPSPGSCLVIVDEVAPYHRTFTDGLRALLGKLPTRGAPRITRWRTGQSRFTVVDPSGNSVIFIQRDEPVDLEYGGSSALDGLAKAIDNARILRDFKADDATAAKVLDAALRKHWDDASAPDRVRALAARAELAHAADDAQRVAELRTLAQSLVLTTAMREALASELAWLGPV